MLYIQPCLTAYPEFPIENNPKFTSNHIHTMVMSIVPSVFLSVLPPPPLCLEETLTSSVRQWTQVAAREIPAE